MKKFITVLTICFLFLAFSSTVFADSSVVAKKGIKTNINDERAAKLANFFEKYNSPLSSYADEMVKTADNYGIDYRLLPAISGVESTFAKFYIRNTYNAYGWGGGYIVFNNWAESFDKVLFSLKNKYIEKGADTVEKISSIYCPPNSKNWARGVISFMEKIENTSSVASISDLTILL